VVVRWPALRAPAGEWWVTWPGPNGPSALVSRGGRWEGGRGGGWV
jgi:hypothetical protein